MVHWKAKVSSSLTDVWQQHSNTHHSLSSLAAWNHTSAPAPGNTDWTRHAAACLIVYPKPVTDISELKQHDWNVVSSQQSFIDQAINQWQDCFNAFLEAKRKHWTFAIMFLRHCYDFLKPLLWECVLRGTETLQLHGIERAVLESLIFIYITSGIHWSLLLIAAWRCGDPRTPVTVCLECVHRWMSHGCKDLCFKHRMNSFLLRCRWNAGTVLCYLQVLLLRGQRCICSHLVDFIMNHLHQGVF